MVLMTRNVSPRAIRDWSQHWPIAIPTGLSCLVSCLTVFLTSEIIMVVIFNQHKHTRGHAKALPIPDLNQPCRLRVGHLQTLYGLSHSAIYEHLKKGLIPPADGVIGGRQYWRTDTIKNDLAK